VFLNIHLIQTDDVYYGSTTQPLSKRLSGHKAHYKQWQKQNYNYVTSFEIIKYDDCYIELPFAIDVTKKVKKNI
jgi:hypothetical protein